MQLSMITGLAFLLAVGGASAAGVTPVQKVIELLGQMKEKSLAEKQDEELEFAKFKGFCESTVGEKQGAIEDANEQIKLLKADVAAYTADANRLAKEIKNHEEDIAVFTGNQKAATKVRAIEKADYDKALQDYSESIDATTNAVAEIKAGAKDRASESLLQVPLLQSSDVPEQAREVIASFLQLEQDPLDVQPPEAKAYESHSDGVVGILGKMTDKFTEKRTRLEKQEIESKNAYQTLMMELKMQLEQGNKDKDAKSEAKAVALQSKANAEGSLEDTISTRDADQKYLTDLTAQCEEKATTFVQRSQVREDEAAAIDKAIEIISSGAVSGAADKHLPSLLDETTSFAQLRSEVSSPTRERTVQFLQKKAEQLHSRVLSALSIRVSTGDPFDKVKKMIKDLIIKLMEEANEEATHKGWCDQELSTNKQTRESKTAGVQTLTAQIDELEASIAKLTEDITALTEGVAELDKAMSEASALRAEEKTKNEETIKDAAAAQTAVAQALTVLQEFYAKAAESASFVQSGEDEAMAAPATQDSSGVVGMLEVIESDFARLEAETKAAEESGEKEYTDFMSDSKIDKTKKATDLQHKEAKKQDQSQTLATKKEELEGTQKELDAAMEYYDKLKPSCVDSGTDYEEKVARRKEEIESLQEALQILQGEDLR